MGAGATAAVTGTDRKADAADKKFTIALIPGLTTDAFYITMRKGAEAAAKAVGADLVFQGAPDFNPVAQVPVLDAVIARKPDAILIAPTDKVQLVEPLKKAAAAGIPVFTVDTFIGTGVYQTGSGDVDFPLAYIASDNILGGKLAGIALAKAMGEKGKVYVSNVKPGISTTDQREEGFKEAIKTYPDIEVLETQFNDDDANKAAARCRPFSAASRTWAASSEPISSPRWCRQWRPAGRQGRQDEVVGLRRADSRSSTSQGRYLRLAIAQHPAEIGYFGVIAAYAHLTGNSVPRPSEPASP